MVGFIGSLPGVVNQVFAEAGRVGLQDTRVQMIAGGLLAAFSGVRSIYSSKMPQLIYCRLSGKDFVDERGILGRLVEAASGLTIMVAGVCLASCGVFMMVDPCKVGSAQERLNYPCRPGYHSTLSPVTGSRANEHKLLAEIEPKSLTGSVLKSLTDQLYYGDSWKIIDVKDKDRADEIANGLYSTYLDRYRSDGVNEKNAVEWMGREKCYVLGYLPGTLGERECVGEGDDWAQWAHVCRGGEEADGFYYPESLVAIHELRHVEETAPHTIEGTELLTSVFDLDGLDRTYRGIHNLDLEAPVDYGKHISVQVPQYVQTNLDLECKEKQIPLNRFIDFYREKTESMNLAEALVSPESIEFLTDCQEASDLAKEMNRFQKALSEVFDS